MSYMEQSIGHLRAFELGFSTLCDTLEADKQTFLSAP